MQSKMQTENQNILRLLVRDLLKNLPIQRFTVQGLGMLRVYLNPKTRLHIWHSGLMYHERPSTIHDHPWTFRSDIIVGELTNIIYREYNVIPGGPHTHEIAQILCGTGGGLIPGSNRPARLEVYDRTTYKAGDYYHQRAIDLHETRYLDGTVTIISRMPLEDPNHAYVAYPLGTTWQSAEPRPAKEGEMMMAVGAALQLLGED